MKARPWYRLSLGGLFLASSLYAADFKLGYINIERIYSEAKPAIAIQKKLDGEFATRREEIKALKEKGEKLQKQIKLSVLAQKNDDKKNENKEDERLNELAAIIHQYETKTTSLAEDFSQRRNEEFAAFLTEVNGVVKKIAVDGNFDLIVQDAVYVNTKHDLTDTLLKALND